MVKNLLAMQAILVRFLGREDPLEKEVSTHSSSLALKIQGQKQATVHGVIRVGHN